MEWSRHHSIRDSIRYGRYVSLCMKTGSLWAVFNTLLLDFTLEVIMYVYVFAGTYLNSICFYYDHILYSLLVPTQVRCQEVSHRVVLYRWITWLIGKQQSGDESSASNVNIVLMSDHTCFNTECILEADHTSECKLTLSALAENVLPVSQAVRTIVERTFND